ncbi:hypothetical protein [Poseidonibacter antarcticus]|uniref:hypothetical protein n=1 Tax=Poseidonibacter antarcticus TaxID=2478538 RepID=UPI000EF452B2|nr:hypothetical protein [Poseidonibacter antarcticus]
MNIYIYGNNSFKKEIHKTLEHANIKFKLDSNSIIEDIEDLEVLKSKIKANPNDIYLIDDEKIIKKNALSQKIKFLTPKDGIEEVFLLDNGIADLSVDSLKEIPKYILRKYEEQKELEPNIQNSIIDMVDEAYEDNNDLDIKLDDELSQLLSSSEKKEEKNVNLDEIENLIKDEDSLNTNFDENVGLNNISSDYDDEKSFDENTIKEKKDTSVLKNEDIDDTTEKEFTKGNTMPNDFTELDSLNEKDILQALEGVDNSDITEKGSEQIELKSSNVQDIAELISKLLNNKTLEITVKIKD